MLDHTQLKSRHNATPFQIRNITRWLHDAKNPIEPKEVEFVQKDEDLIPLVTNEKTPLRRFIDKFDLIRLASCFRERKVSHAIATPT